MCFLGLEGQMGVGVNVPFFIFLYAWSDFMKIGLTWVILWNIKSQVLGKKKVKEEEKEWEVRNFMHLKIAKGLECRNIQHESCRPIDGEKPVWRLPCARRVEKHIISWECGPSPTPKILYFLQLILFWNYFYPSWWRHSGGSPRTRLGSSGLKHKAWKTHILS